MTSQQCPNCGAELPQEEGQHALSPSAGTIECPNCGATVNLEGPPGAEGGPPREGSAEGEPVTTEASLEATEQPGLLQRRGDLGRRDGRARGQAGRTRRG